MRYRKRAAMERDLAAGDRTMESAFCAAPADASAIAMPDSAWVVWPTADVVTSGPDER